MMTERFQYDNRIVKNFLLVTILWGVVGMLVGLTAALQMVIPGFNITEYFSFGRVRPLHTNAVIFAFVGNGIFAGAYYSMQRLLKTRGFRSCWRQVFWLAHLPAPSRTPFGVQWLLAGRLLRAYSFR